MLAFLAANIIGQMLANYSVWTYRETPVTFGNESNHISFDGGHWHMDMIVQSDRGGSIWYGPHGQLDKTTTEHGNPDTVAVGGLTYQVQTVGQVLYGGLKRISDAMANWFRKLYQKEGGELVEVQENGEEVPVETLIEVP